MASVAARVASLSFFGTDGIRDRAGEGRLTAPNVRRVGAAIGAFARARYGAAVRVGVARDPRPSGPSIVAGLVEGLAGGGAFAAEPVGDAGVLPTPALAWAVAAGLFDVGVMVTASHNPAPDNGIKVLLRGGRKTSPEEEAEIEARMPAAERVSGAVAAGWVAAGLVARPDVLDRYLAAAVVRLSAGGRLDGVRLVVDCANGATRGTARRVLEALGATVATPVGSDPAGTINDRCGTEHPAAWREAVREAADGADDVAGGLAFDGDGDRVLLCDAAGEVLDGDVMLHLLALDLHGRGALPGQRVVSTSMANLGLEEVLAARGIALDRTDVGDRHVAERMRATGAVLGGEPSGHVLLAWDGALIGDGVVAGVASLQAARRRGRTLAACRAEVPRHPHVLKSVRMARRAPLETPGFAAAVAAAQASLGGAGRVVVRYSGTEPVLRLMVEGRDAAAVAAAVSALEAAAHRFLTSDA